MTSYSVSDAKNRLSALLAQVRRGARIVITDRGAPVAVLVPPDAGGEPQPAAARLASLVRAGLVVRRSRKLPSSILGSTPPSVSGKASVVRALLAERDEHR